MREKNFASTQEIGVRTAERRQAARIHLQVPMFVRGIDALGEEFIELAKTLDISANGAYLTVPRPLRKLALITLTVPAPSISNSGLIPTSMPPIQSRVIRQKEVGDVYLVGVQFTKPLD
ncbi:MAG: PilZ domain-containing protein [Candidatus Acidiferrales bacterium]